MSTDFAIRVRDVTKVYGSLRKSESIRALDGVSLAVSTGSVFGLLGPNGAGKTTLVKILLGLVNPSTGSATIAGIDTRNPMARAVIGFLPENHRFPNFLTGKQLLTHYGQMAGVDKQTIQSRIPKLLDQVDMTKWADTKIKKYSKGMMQRIGLAQSLVNDPDVIFLDEPTDGVDPVGRREIRKILQWLKDQGKTIFLNSHLLSEVEQICTEVAILNHGKLIAEGSIADLTKTTGAYTIVVESRTIIDADLSHILGNPVKSAAGQLMSFTPDIKDRSSLNEIIDKLRAGGAQIESVQPSHQSLEDSFIDLLDIPETE